MTKGVAVALLSGFLVLASSCKKKDALDGIDKTALFAAPSTEELEAVEAGWKTRTLVPQDITIEETLPVNNKLTYHLVSFRLHGHKQYAGVLVPSAAKALPVQLYVSGFSLEDPVSSQVITVSNADTLPFVYVLPALRGQFLSMTVNGAEHKSPFSEGVRNDAFDGAADDVIACLNAVGTVFSGTDTSKVMIRGGSRGGTVALLVAERDKRVKLAAGVAFPANLVELTASHQNDETYNFQFLDALINKSATLKETRLKMIASSPYYFCRFLPKTQIHFGENDNITPARQGEALFNAMKALGMEDRMELFIYKNRGHSDVADNNPEMQERIHTFFSQLF